MRWFSIGNLGQVTYAEHVKPLEQWFEEAGARLFLGCRSPATNANPSFNEWPGQPRPNGSVVVRLVAGRTVSMVLRGVFRLFSRQGPQTERRPQSSFGGINHPARPFPDDRRERKPTNCKDLIWPE